MKKELKKNNEMKKELKKNKKISFMKFHEMKKNKKNN